MSGDPDHLGGWMDSASAGDDNAFGRLAGVVQDDLYRFALAHGLRGHDAAEAVQEALLRAYRGRMDWRQGGDVLTWLCGITLNVVREMRRAQRRGHVFGIELDALQAGEPRVSDQTLRDLAVALEQLPPRQREAVVCRYLRRLSVRETAAVMACAEGTVKAAVAAALENLRNCATLRYLREEP